MVMPFPARVVPDTVGAENPVLPEGGADATSCWSVQAETKIEHAIIATSSRPWVSCTMLLRPPILPGYRSNLRAATDQPAVSY